MALRRFLAVILAFLPGCVSSYTEALGYRARQAALQNDVEAFEPLMAEAASAEKVDMMHMPKRTVLTHFLDLAGDDRFFPTIEGWRAKGWVSDNLTCAIHRARYRHAADPAEARRSADVCVERARSAAYGTGRAWEVEACLESAPFLTQTSTAALTPYLRVAADPAEPRALRWAILDGMSRRYLQETSRRAVNDPDVPRVVHRAAAEAQAEATAARLVALLTALEGAVDPALLASGTAYGALELERAATTRQDSFVWRWALADGAPDRADLAYGWVRTLKSRELDRRLESLGLWNRNVEPERDGFWYACLQVEVDRAFGAARVRARPLLATSRADPAAVAARCGARRPFGPLPLKAMLRGAVTASVAATANVPRVGVVFDPTARLERPADGDNPASR